jgi:hypothetical protein
LQNNTAYGFRNQAGEVSGVAGSHQKPDHHQWTGLVGTDNGGTRSVGNGGFVCPALFHFRLLSCLAVHHLHVFAFFSVVLPYSLQYVCALDVWFHTGEFMGTLTIPCLLSGMWTGSGYYTQYNALYALGQISAEELYMLSNVPTLGASGAVMGIFAAFAYTFPNSQMIILPIPFPIKAKWALLGLAVLDLIGGVSSASSGIAHFAHLGGAAVGIIIVLIWNRRNRNRFY